MRAIKSHFIGSIVFVLCLLVLQSFSGALELDRQQMLLGEIWRLWTGHFVHTHMLHLLLNASAAVIIYYAFFTRVRAGELLAFSLFFSPLISMALLHFYPELGWYNGLSGLLHALIAFFSIRLARNGDAAFWFVLGAVWVKVLIESSGVNLGSNNLMDDMRVISEGHLVGTFIGTLTAIFSMAFWSDTKKARNTTITSKGRNRAQGIDRNLSNDNHS